ncbi:glycoside hydrolase family 11 protein [Cellulophaga baltica]|uniref:glycoside hydrolase family 11 protein n=1 Tax=Cellulophaga baltica TaxID=76594 RepID=UPI0003FACA69|nr:glycoside hydrolase family 11 protein [Cellulophaga baltica]
MMKKLKMFTFLLGGMLLVNCSTEDADTSTSLEELDVLKFSATQAFFVGDDRTDATTLNGGYWWTIYKEGGWGKLNFSGAQTYPGNFEIEYKNNQDIVGGKGWEFGQWNRVINYNIGTLEGSYKFVGAYGWVKATSGELIEYYIVEKKKGDGIPGVNKNQDFTVNNKNYRFLIQDREGPSVEGDKKFKQFISENKNPNSIALNVNQRISFQKHAEHWGTYGNEGSLNNWGWYQVFGIESFNYTPSQNDGNGNWGKINATIW